MISLKLPDGSFFPLITQAGETKKYTLTPAIPGAHPIKIPFFTQIDHRDPAFSGIVTIDGSGEELTLTISLDAQGEYTALVVDRGNGTTGTFSALVSAKTEQSFDPDMEYEQSLQEQIALVDNYFEDPTIEEDSIEESLEDLIDQDFDQEEVGDFEEPANFFQMIDTTIDSRTVSTTEEPVWGEADQDLEEDEFTLFEDDEEFSDQMVEQDNQVELESDIGSDRTIRRNQGANPWMVAGIGILVLALGYLGAYGIFTLVRSDAFPLLEQVFL